MEKLQHQAATLKKMNTPSDDPVGAAKVLEIRTDKVNNDQFQMNGKLAEMFLNNSDHAIGELAEVVARCKEIALGQSSGASANEDTRLGIAEEVTQLFQQAVAAANRRVGDRYLFGGYKTNKPPVDPDGRYQGDDGNMMVEIARDVFLSMNVPGLEIFNTNPSTSSDAEAVYGGPARQPAQDADSDSEELQATGQKAPGYDPVGPENINVFDEIQNFRISLLTGDTEGIRSSLERFDRMHSGLIAMRAKIGSRVQGLQSIAQSQERHNIVNAQLSSALEDADMAQVVSDLAKEETVFRSSLASSQRLIQPTLMDFLK